ncbi:MAG: hypothetical protein JJD92_11285, partial [Frankiaceae bacterium]|nr:hypothetical protein [Frankiaceae bacterium]
LHNAAIAEESYATDNDGVYFTANPVVDTASVDFNPSTNVTIAAAGTGSTSYTLTGSHSSFTGCSMVFDSTTGKTTETGC